MDSLSFGFLFKRVNINFNNKKYELWKYQDFIYGINCENTENRIVFLSCSEKYSNMLFYTLNEESIDSKNIEYIVKPFSLDVFLEAAKDNKLDLRDLLSFYNENKFGYFSYNRSFGHLNQIKDKNLLKYLDSVESNSNYNNTKMRISDMYENIKKTIFSQDEQIMQILTTIYKNQKVINSNLEADYKLKLKENILVFGPTGTGKTEILNRIANFYDIPIVIENATSLSEVGYVGRESSEMLYSLYLAAERDINKAECGILVIDEFDKLAEQQGSESTHVSRIGVQRELLKILEGSICWVKDSNSYDKNRQIKFNTKNLTVVCLGAFSSLFENKNNQGIGFNCSLDNNANKKINTTLTTTDFIKYGIMRELIGRFSKLIQMNSLSKEDLKKILINSNFSPLYTYKKLFDEMNIEFVYDDDFIEWVVNKAILLNIGARSLKTIVDKCISDALFKIFDEGYSKIELVAPCNDNGKPYILTKNF